MSKHIGNDQLITNHGVEDGKESVTTEMSAGRYGDNEIERDLDVELGRKEGMRVAHQIILKRMEAIKDLENR